MVKIEAILRELEERYETPSSENLRPVEVDGMVTLAGMKLKMLIITIVNLSYNLTRMFKILG